jgi:hypothetical protein
MINFLIANRDSEEIIWWMGLSQRNIYDVIEELILPPSKNTWVDEYIMLASITFRSRIFILEQNSGLFLKMHMQILLYFPEFAFENDLYLCHCNFGSPEGINTRMDPISLNHYGALKLMNDDSCDQFNFETLVDLNNQFLDEQFNQKHEAQVIPQKIGILLEEIECGIPVGRINSFKCLKKSSFQSAVI